MHEKNLNQRLLIIGIVIALGAIMIYPPSTKLRPGLDIAGGTSMIFEIQTEQNDDPKLAEQMKTLLQKRVDPQGVYDLAWRVVGKNRLEVQMPLAPPENKRLREEFLKAQDELFKARVLRSDLQAACRMPAEQRPAKLRELADGSTEREKLLVAAAEAWDRYSVATKQMDEAKANPATTQLAESKPADETGTPPLTTNLEELRKSLRTATEDWENAVANVMDTNFDPARFEDLLELDEKSSRRQSSLDDLIKLYPNLETKIKAAVAKHSEWRKNRVYLESADDLKRLLKGSGVLEFRILVSPEPGNETKYDRLREDLKKIGTRARTESEGWFKIDNAMQFFDLKSPAELKQFETTYKSNSRMVIEKRGSDWFVLSKMKSEDGLLSAQHNGPNWKLRRVGISRDRAGRRCVQFDLDTIGGSYFRTLTKNNKEHPLCILVDDIAYTAPNIKSEIGSSGVIEGDFSAEKINYLIQTMQAGSLPGKLKDTPVSERTIGSSLGQKNLEMAFRAGMIGLLAVVVVMLVYYRKCGAVAVLAMVLNLFLTLAAMAMIGARFNLVAIAGIILGIGIAVDSNILIFERMREEKERGSSLRMIIKNGYDKAFTTIFDSHVTMLLTSAIIYYVGSEEIKGFGLTLGWGIVLNLFTAVFVTRTIDTLLVKFNVLKDANDLVMMHLFGVPKIDWYRRRRWFFGGSIVLTVVGLGLLLSRGPRNILDVEFLGGVNAEVQVRKDQSANWDDVRLRRQLNEVGRSIAQEADNLKRVIVEPVPGDLSSFLVRVPGLRPNVVAAMIAEPLEDGESGQLLARNGVQLLDDHPDALQVRVRSVQEKGPDGKEIEHFPDAERMKGAIQKLADDRSNDSIVRGGDDIARANVGQVLGTAADEGKIFAITTTETNKELVKYALVTALGDSLLAQHKVSYTFRGEGERPYPITDAEVASVIKGLPPTAAADLTDYIDGAAMFFDDLKPPQTEAGLTARIKNMRFAPDYQDLPYRDARVFGIEPAGLDADGHQTYKSVVIAVVDPTHPYRGDAEAWWTQFAQPELRLAKATFDQEQMLQKVTTFKPQIAAQSQTKGLLAMALAWAMIIAYLWIRFGKMRYGVGAVVALIHDVCIALAFVGISGWIGGGWVAKVFLIEDFKIDMTVLAALLTIIGYSVNDTIVVYDRVREMRGRLGIVTPKIVNHAINSTLSRTVMTVFTVFLVLLIMYIWGGVSIRGFSYCMLVGVLRGCYTSIAIAAPLLLVGTKESAEAEAAPAGNLATA